MLTPEQMQDGLLRLEADLLDLTTQVSGMAGQQKRMGELLIELGAAHLRLDDAVARLQDAVEKFLRARTDGEN